MVQTSTRPMPSFMSVFGDEVSKTGSKDSTHGNAVGRPASSGNIGAHSSNVPFAGFHIHRDSTSTLASESSDSSPTTTISTMDSSSATEISPGPSPESPSARIAPSSFVADFRSRRTESSSTENPNNAFFELQRPVTPAKKPRNLKNLGINTASSLSNLRCNATASLPVLATKEKNTSAPTSPSFIKPPTPPKRRPSNLSLTIQTPGSDPKPTRLIIPSTPSLNRPALRHFQSSPSLPLCSPSVVPAGGMRLPALRTNKTNPHGFAEVPVETEEEDQEPNFDIPQSREEKPAAYPNGPICIYESGVYLYFEPTAEQAATFDVIVNVASEVKNPFTSASIVSQKELDARRVDGPPAENVDFSTLLDRPKASSVETQSSSPTTPKATPVLETTQPVEHVINGVSVKAPEYIHMPWEHNTDIVPDLYKLVKMMDERVQQGKRVLVHCQCGVSRSASLIVAYGIYKNPGISVQEAYDAVKKRSKWIGPNMNLIMQLQEFRNGLVRANDTRHGQVYGMPRRSAGLSTGMSAGTNICSPFSREVGSGPRTPRTAPLPPESDLGMQRASTGNMMAISPGPLSAPSGVLFSPGFRRSWASSQTHFDLSPKSSPTKVATPYVDPKGHVVPVLSITHNDQSQSVDDERPNEDSERPQIDADLKPPPVPNFSRQLPLRTSVIDGGSDEHQSTLVPSSERFLTTSDSSFGLGALRSPAVASFNIPSSPPGADDDDFGLRSPVKTEFSIPPWSRSDDSQTMSRVAPPALHQPSTSGPGNFHMTGLDSNGLTGPFSLLPPKAPHVTLARSPTDTEDDSSEQFEISSPTVTEFPKDPFASAYNGDASGLTSPRAAEFHMTPLKPKIVDEDPFGLTSPKKFEFPASVFGRTNLPDTSITEPEHRRPSFQAILPPSGFAQPEAENGLTSLNGIASSQSMVQHATVPKMEFTEIVDAPNRIDSLSISPEPPATEPSLPHTPTLSYEVKPVATTSPESLFLSTPSKHPTIRTRFSSPNMREQRRLHKIQTEMEAKLPQKAQPPQAVDDLDALMSPRAEEFTRNPFHFDLRSPGDDTSPASSIETIKENSSRTWTDTTQLTPQKVIEDPRSPVQTGSSPIVRNIWDVL